MHDWLLPKEFSQLTQNYVNFKTNLEADLSLSTTKEDLDDAKIFDKKAYEAYKKRNADRAKIVINAEKNIKNLEKDLVNTLGAYNFIFSRTPEESKFLSKKELA